MPPWSGSGGTRSRRRRPRGARRRPSGHRPPARRTPRGPPRAPSRGCGGRRLGAASEVWSSVLESGTWTPYGTQPKPEFRFQIRYLACRPGPKSSSPGAPHMPTTTTNKWLALALLAAAQFVVILDASIVNVALPSIGAALNFSQDDLS